MGDALNADDPWAGGAVDTMNGFQKFQERLVATGTDVKVKERLSMRSSKTFAMLMILSDISHRSQGKLMAFEHINVVVSDVSC